MGNLKWPAFIIQAIILATNVSFLLKGGGQYINMWTMLSLLLILALFAIQTTDKRWIFLFPVHRKFNSSGRLISETDTPALDTYILRAGIALAAFFLFIGVAMPTCLLLSASWKVLLPLAILLILVFPFIFNRWLNRWILDTKVKPKFSKFFERPN